MEVRANLVAYRGHMLPVWSVASCPHHGFYFASAGADRTARVWSTERAQPLRIMAGAWTGREGSGRGGEGRGREWVGS